MTKRPIIAVYVSVFLLCLDVSGLTSLFAVSYFFRFGVWPDHLAVALVWPITLILFSLYIVDAYRIETRITGIRTPVRSIVGVGIGGLLSAAAAYIGGYWGTVQFFGRGVFPVALLLFGFWAAVTRWLMNKWTKQHAEQVRWLALGDGEPAQQLWIDIKSREESGELAFLAEQDRRNGDTGSVKTNLPVAGTIADLDNFDLKRYAGIIVTLRNPLPEALVKKLMQVRLQGTPVYDMSDFYERYWSKVPVLHLHDGWFVFSSGFDLLQNPIGLRLKRALDLLMSGMFLIVAAPLILVLMFLIRLDSSGPAVYRQRRIGEGGAVFTLYKFRSMTSNAEQDGAKWASVGDARTTRVGKLLRTTRLDELPQLWNVLRGDMSFIGPRPERPEFTAMLEKQIPYYDLRHLVKPGITGWAQVMYSYGASVDDAREKLQYDLYYIKHYSLLLDVAILFKTVRVVLLGRGR